MTTLDVYSRRGCHLCEVLIDELLPIVKGRLEVRVHDVDTRPEWQAAYGDSVPVVACDGGIICRYRLDRAAVLAVLDRAPGPA